MSLKFADDGDKAVVTGGSSQSVWSACVAFCPTATSTGIIMFGYASGVRGVCINSSGNYAAYNSDPIAPTNTVAAVVGEWCYFVVLSSGGTTEVYHLDDTAGTAVETLIWSTGSGGSANSLYLGDGGGNITTPAYGKYRYARFFGAHLDNATKRNNERNSTTAVLTALSSWKLPDGTTTTDDIGTWGGSMVITSGATDADEPPWISSGASGVMAQASYFARLRA